MYSVFWLRWWFLLGHVPHAGPVLGPTSAAVIPQKQVVSSWPNLRTNGPKFRHVKPWLRRSWAQVGVRWPKFVASSAVNPVLIPYTAQLGPKLLPNRCNVHGGQVQAKLRHVGPTWAQVGALVAKGDPKQLDSWLPLGQVGLCSSPHIPPTTMLFNFDLARRLSYNRGAGSIRREATRIEDKYNIYITINYINMIYGIYIL
jgi:hypothetical protein